MINEEPHTLLTRFQTPDPRIAPRERAPMLEQERAWAQFYAFGQRFSWIEVLVPPLCFAPVLPGLAFLLALLLWRGLVDSQLDIDAIIGGSFAWLALATVLFFAAWVLHNLWRDKRDPTKLYWQRMPDEGDVELERHTLVAGITLWSNDYDPDCNSLMQWVDGQLMSVQDSGVTQWVLATTAAGHWLVIKKQFPGNFSYERVGRMPARDQHLQPTEDLAVAFAPGTNLPLGQRAGGEPVPMVDTSYWLAGDELKRLVEVAHHWAFSPPDRYGVVNEKDAHWVQRLVDKACDSATQR